MHCDGGMFAKSSFLILLVFVVALDAKPKPRVEVQRVIPEGWRRTVHGWEHTSNWLRPIPADLNELIEKQREQEPIWMQASIQSIRQISPVRMAGIQLALIALIFSLNRHWANVSSRNSLGIQPPLEA